MKKVKIALAALTIAAFAFDGCKKGDGDPFLSLASRKARITGDWTVTKGEGTKTSTVSSVSSTTTVTYDGTTETDVTGSFTSTDKYTEKWSIEKDGTFTYTYTDNNGSSPDVTTYKGTWNWTGGVGDNKKKAQVVFYIESITDSNGTTTYTGSNRSTVVYDIYELKGKEMIFYDKGDQSTTGSSSTSDIKWTLTQ
ncbi:MAG TPA: hypothetical protein VL651_08580 [Bacteroidia bacterium]|jgi:hypothetical protein|nr:hypothetical protein [Bacteroidia bacterium]